MEAIFVSTGLVALAEMGDKTQLLALLLTARFQRPVPILAGILVATIANHALAAWAGFAVGQWLEGPWFRYGVGVGFLAMAAWALVPDQADDDVPARTGHGVFAATLVAFFVVEIGDKTQIATSLLAARFAAVLPVTVGTTAGMMLANVPAVLFGQAITRLVPLRAVRIGAAAVLAALGAAVLLAT